MAIGTQAPLLTLAAIRAAIYVAAIPLAPFLWQDHFLILVLLRPTKEVFLAAGFALKRDEIELFELTLAAFPLTLLGVWLFYFLAVSLSQDIKNERLRGLQSRILPAKKINALKRILDRKGKRFVILGRLAAIGSTLIASAAGTFGMERRDFLPADAAGAILSFSVSVAAGWGLGATYERAGPWLTVVAALALVASAILLARYLKRS